LLVDREWVEIGDNGFRLTAPAKLLSEWEENYDYRHNVVRGFYMHPHHAPRRFQMPK
jgi:hypothetical protein